MAQEESQTSSYSPRIDAKVLWGKILSGFDLEKGILFTLVQLSIRPGSTILNYIQGERKLLNPFKYFILVASLFFVLNTLHIKYDPNTPGLESHELKMNVIPYIFMLGIVLLSSITTFLFTRKLGFNLFEIGVLTLYLVIHLFLIEAVVVSFFALLIFLISGNIGAIYDRSFQNIFFIAFTLSYLFWSYKTFFKVSIFKSIGLTLVSVFIASGASLVMRPLLDFLFPEKTGRVGITFSIPEEDKEIQEGLYFKSYKARLKIDSVYANTAASQAGLKKGDYLRKVDGAKTNSFLFNMQVRQHNAGETILIEIERDDQAKHVPVTLMHADSLFLNLDPE